MNAPADDAAASGERKLLTLLFVDLSGYTRMTATRDPEDVQATVAPLLAQLRRTAEEHGGYVPSVQGDGFLAVYGAPTTDTDTPRRAVAAAQAMRALIEARRTADSGVPNIHVGIASGEVLVTSRPGGHDLVGAAVNLAARLSDAAAAGEILVDERTATMTVQDAVYASPRPLELAGFVGRVAGHPLERLERRRPSPDLVGRAAEHAAVERAFEQAQVLRSTEVLAVTGEAGIGKSTLVAAWASAHPGTLTLNGACRAYGAPLPMSALVEAVASPALPAHAADARANLEQLLASGPGRSPREPDAALVLAARRLLESISRSHPAVLVLEDVHWADAALLEFVAGLRSDPLPGALLVVLTSREPVPGVPAVSLPPLTTPEIAHVVQRRHGAPPAADLLALLAEHSAGNPLWLVEYLGLLGDRGELHVEGGRVLTRRRGEEVPVPSSIRLLVSARVDRLSAGQKRALQRVSVWPDGLPRAQWTAGDADLETLGEVGLLRRTPDHVQFAHGLVREAVYRSMPRAARVAEHESLLAVTTDAAVRAHAAAEVHRLEVAPDTARRRFVAERALRAAIDHARELQLSHSRAACDVLLRAADLVDDVSTVAPQACADLLTELARLLRDLEDVDRSRDVAERAVEIAASIGEDQVMRRAELALAQALVGSDNATAREIGSRLVKQEGVPGDDIAAAWRLLAGTWVYDDMAEAMACLTKAFDASIAGGDLEGAADVARQLAWNLSVTADTDFDHWYDVAVRHTPSGHVLGQGQLALIRAVVAQARGQVEESWQAAMEAAALTERVGMHRSLVDALSVATEAATESGRREALPGLLSRLTAAAEGRRARLQVTALCASAPALAVLGRSAEASAALEQASALLPSVGPNEATMVSAAQAHVAELVGDPARAAEAYLRAEELASGQRLTLFAAGCRLQRMALLHSQGEQVSADDVDALVTELQRSGAGVLAARARQLAP